MDSEAKEYKLGTKPSFFGEESITRSFTFVLTQDCNLACGYCYMVGKNRHSKMTWDVAKKAVDFILAQDYPEETVILEFIGGEPFLEVDLMDQICDYFQLEMYRTSHKWLKSYAFSIATNGVLYSTPKAQHFIKKHREHVSVGITIDGIKEKHDMFRKFPNGEGSYDIVSKNIRLWLEQFPNASTKVTFASDDLPYLKDSIIHLWDMGITNVPANVVFEDVWKEGDDLILEQQLRDLADYAIDTGLWKTHICTFFSDTLGQPANADYLSRNWCGSGMHMTAIDHQGKLYPCVRFMDYSLTNKQPVVLGDIDHGIDPDRLRPFAALNVTTQSSDECLTCEMATGCAWCQGFNYDAADTDTIYQRATAICKMHKAQVRANDYYFARLAKVKGTRIENRHSRTLFLITAENAVPVCNYPNAANGTARMSDEVLQQGLKFAAHNGFFPILLQPVEGLLINVADGVPAWNVVSADRAGELNGDLVVYDNAVSAPVQAPISMLLLNRENLANLAEFAQQLLSSAPRVVLVLRDTHDFTPADFDLYEAELGKISEVIARSSRHGRHPEFSVLTDRIWLSEMDNCNAGVKTFALAPNGLLYICPGFYYADPASAVGSLETGIDPRKVALCEFKRAPICSDCQAFHCKRCVLDNKRFTGELNTPSRSQCLTSHVELRQSAELGRRLHANWPDDSFSVTALDPFESKLSSKY